MATYNGQAHLEAQLQSLLAQTVGDLHILARDDGSTDETYEILEHWKTKWPKGRFVCTRGDRLGFADNYRWLIRNLIFDADYYGFCDQDDIWLPDKLAVAAETLETKAQDQLGLYCSRTRMFSDRQAGGQYSPLFGKPPHLKNALVQSLAGGNTMVMNRQAWQLYRQSVERARFVSHDWWAYLMITGAGGVVYYDPKPHIHYRQHGTNQIGSNSTLGARLTRIVHMLSGGWSRWTDLNLSGLQKNRDLLTTGALELLEKFEAMRAQHPIAAIKMFRDAGFYRQTGLSTLSMLLAIVLRRL